MINNFQAIRDLLTFGDEDKFYFIQIYKRRKDNPDMKKDMVWRRRSSSSATTTTQGLTLD
jgi:hypothetical protein